MKRFKKRSKFFIVLSCLFAFIGLFSFSSLAYELDDNGNMVSSNLMAYPEISETTLFGVTFSTNDYGYLLLDGTSTSGSWRNYTTNTFTLDPGTYTIQWFTDLTMNGVGYGLYNSTTGDIYQLTTERYRTFTLNSTLSFSVVVWWNASGKVFNNNYIGAMVYSGVYDSSQTYEPYGYTWYSQNNYNTYGTQQYNSGYNNATDDLIADMITFSVMNNYYSNAIAFISTDRGSTYSSYTSAVNFEQTDTYLLAELSDNVSWGTLDNGYMYYINVSFTTPLNLYRVYTPASQSCTFTSIEIDGRVFSGFNYAYIDGVGSWYLDNINTLCSGFKIYFYGNSNSSNDIYLYATGYNTGATAYQNGYDKGVSDTTSQYESVVNSLNDTISSLSSQLSTLNKKLKTLEKGVSNYQNLIWTIGATPWESFKHIWNVEFGGINIANIVTGFVTALLVIYLIKKFWR